MLIIIVITYIIILICGFMGNLDEITENNFDFIFNNFVTLIQNVLNIKVYVT